MADSLNMNGLSLNDSRHAPGGRAYIPPHLRGQSARGPPPMMGMDGAGPGPVPGPVPGPAPNGTQGLNGSAWATNTYVLQ
jgi:ATP-dependent RNA helicase DDX3X